MDADSKTDTVLRVFLDYRDRLESCVFRIVGCRATAADIIQDLFLRLWRRPIERPDDSAGYLFRSARNLAVDHLRSVRVRARHEGSPSQKQHDEESPSPDTLLAARDDLRRIDKALRALPKRTRHVFLLHRVHGRSYPEIARALGVSISTIEKDMMRALAACKAGLYE
jgi:RNA polymerase sigma-70 factor (ECF subfamily)